MHLLLKAPLNLLKINYELVISDVRIHHFDGFELVKFIEAKNNIPIIILMGINKYIINSTITITDAILSKPYYGN